MEKFEDIVRRMTAKEIIMAMVDGLKNPAVNVDMSTFGSYDIYNKACYGCAATNAICKISNHVLTFSEIDNKNRAITVNSDYSFLHAFERAIDNLRKGDILRYNNTASIIGIATIKNYNFYLPHLYTDNYNQLLDYYEDLANAQK